MFPLLFVAGAAVARPPIVPQFTSISVNGTTLTLKAVNGTSGGQICAARLNERVRAVDSDIDQLL
jgi:hypothetical protein